MLRRRIDEGVPASELIETLVNDIIVDGQELLTTEVSVDFLCSRLREDWFYFLVNLTIPRMIPDMYYPTYQVCTIPRLKCVPSHVPGM